MIKKLYKNNIYSQYIINIMVLSVLRKDKIQYNEGRKIDPEDIDHSSFVYETCDKGW